ncbi:MAG TPA: xanthine dehydrogenase family protein molybdopterin-binding subunit [Isosphaeraceae bacterium]
MPTSWPDNTKVIGGRHLRLDGMAKASGKAKYPSDVHPEGLLFVALLYSPHPHAKIKSIDLEPALKSPGVKAAVLLPAIEPGKTLRYVGDPIAAVAAETEEQATDAVRAIKVEYEVLPHVVTEEQATSSDAPEVFKSANTAKNVRRGRAQVNGDPEAALAKADAVIEGIYTAPVITHVCLESHGMTVQWKPDSVESWASTQAVGATANDLAGYTKLPQAKVTVHTEVMGGGFGSKFNAEAWGFAAADLSKASGGRPVRMFLDRAHEHLTGGNRPSAIAKVKIGATKDGKLVGLTAETSGTGGATAGAAFPFPYVYAVPAFSRSHSDIFTNNGNARAMRAPGHPQACFVMESAMDDLAHKLGMDPLEFRLKNLKDKDMVADAFSKPTFDRTPVYRGEIAQGAELFGWKAKWKPRGQNGAVPIKRGVGMALHQWGGGGPPTNQVACTINPDGSVEMKSATQDIGTGARTVFAIIAAEVFGLKPTDITSNIGNSTFPPGQGSGGSTTTPAMSPPAYNAAILARDEMFNKIAGSVGAQPQDLSLDDGQLKVKGVAKMSWKDACRKLGLQPIQVVGRSTPGLASSSGGVGGVQFAEVTVDVETGVVRLKKVVAIQDSGLIIDKLTWESQVYGGIIGSLNYGLFEERVMDPTTGKMLNADMELYKLAGASDIPEIVVKAYEPPEVKARGVIGIGEPPTISTSAAIGNAVANAIGVRVPNMPFSPMNVLNALATQEGKA